MNVKVSDYVADFFAKRNITQVFTVTGGGAMHLNDSFARNTAINCIYNHHEQASAMAAEAFTRLTGNVSVLCVTTGPGGTNALTGVMGAWLDSIPVFVISGQEKCSSIVSSTILPLRQLGFQEFNIINCVKTMTKYAVVVKDAELIAYYLEKALYIATHGRCGPVWLDIPLDIQGAVIDTSQLKYYNEVEDINILPPKITAEKINHIMHAIENAKRPVILAGNGIRLGNALTEFYEVIENMHIPVVTAWNAHDLIADDHPLFAGRPGTIGTRGGNFVIQNSDLLLSFGCRMHVRLIGFQEGNFAKNAYKIAVDIDKAELYKPTLQIDYPVHADVKNVLEELLMRKKCFSPKTDWIQWCKTVNKKYPVVLEAYRKTVGYVNPYFFMERLSFFLKDSDVTVASNGTACVCALQVIELKKGQRMFTNAGASSMGYGLPAAIGAALATKKAGHIICLEGDGSIQMNIQELQTISYHKFDIKVFWLNNGGYHSIRQTQKIHFHGETAGYYGIDAKSGLSFPNVEKIAYAYGLRYYLLDSQTNIDKILASVFSTTEPVLCEVVLDTKQEFAPKLTSRILPDGKIISPSLEDMSPFLSEEELKSNMLN